MRVFFFFQAEDGIRDLVRSRGLGDVYKRQQQYRDRTGETRDHEHPASGPYAGTESDGRYSHCAKYHGQLTPCQQRHRVMPGSYTHLTLPTSDLV